MASPLKQLIEIHVREAMALGLLRISSEDSSTISEELDSIWATNPDDLTAFYRGVDRIADYSASMTWLQFDDQANASPVVHRITRITDLKHPLGSTLGAAGRRIDEPRRQLKTLLDTANITPLDCDPSVQSSLSTQLRRICEDLRECLCDLPPSRSPSKLKAVSLHSPATKAWIVPSLSTIADANAQEIRDELGLIHYPLRNQPLDLTQSLVHMSFETNLSSAPLPTTTDPAFLLNQVKGQWLVRPTICHGPNERFSQRHNEDASNVAHHGRTINISDASYQYGSTELILLHGDDAELTWKDLRLLRNKPAGRPIDSDHKGFLDCLAYRLGHALP